MDALVVVVVDEAVRVNVVVLDVVDVLGWVRSVDVLDSAGLSAEPDSVIDFVWASATPSCPYLAR